MFLLLVIKACVPKTIFIMKKIVLSIILLCFSGITASAQSKSNTIRLTLNIYNSDSALLDQTYGQARRQDDNAVYDLSGPALTVRGAGIYTFSIKHPGYYDYETRVMLTNDTTLNIYLLENYVEFNGLTVKATSARDKSGFVSTRLSARQLSIQNLGQDFTYLIGNTASAVTTSDAGSGIGYTGIRIRGSDATRINVTINGIPINDAESHGVFWVNMPDLASSTSSVQIQRGVGSSTNGTGSFGANINIQNTEISPLPYLQIQQSVGSFNTSKSTLQFGTGKLNNFNFSGRLSKIKSDGYIDRGASDLQAFQFNMNYLKGKWSVDAVSFGGKEKTYQSWYGTPESRVKNDVEGMNAYADRNYLSDAQRANLLNSGRTYNYYTYDNQTDNYWQNHYQLHIGHTFNKYMSLKSSFFTTTGKGYYEEFKEGASFTNYGVANYISGTDTQTNTDLVRQRWLDNVFYGNFTSFNYKKGRTDLIAGASYSEYHGNHFGRVIWAGLATPFGKDYKYYNSKSAKKEFNSFVKLNYRILPALRVDAEMQARTIDYHGKGNDNDLKTINFNVNYLFLNPKVGFVYDLSGKHSVYGSFSVGNREPVRNDFIDNPVNEVPKAENLQDMEIGYIYKDKKSFLQVNVYNMAYRNQLVVTGELNDVGSNIRRNVAKSFRRGVELIATREIMRRLVFEGNLTLSRNKIVDFEDVYADYDNGTILRDNYHMTDIAFSPAVIGFAGLTDKHIRNTDISINCKYVGKQYLDNTLNNSRKLDNYYTINLLVQRTFKMKKSVNIVLKGMVNNLGSINYSNNGYTFKYVSSGQLTVENFYYPQSLSNFMIGVDFKFF
jgi:iron complex outermembrane receptor protein